MLLAAAMLFGTAACSGNHGKDEDPTKTYLDVGVFDAGLGTTYFDEMKKDFEAYYANESFEEGKMGVVVRPLKKNTEFNPQNLLNSMKNLDPVLYFLDQGDYEAFTEKGYFADVTDVMTEKYLDEDGNLASETKKEATQSIEDTMLEGYADVSRKRTSIMPCRLCFRFRELFTMPIYSTKRLCISKKTVRSARMRRR